MAEETKGTEEDGVRADAPRLGLRLPRAGVVAALAQQGYRALTKEEKNDLARNSKLLQVCTRVGVRVVLPRVYLLGPESSGKSTLVVMLLGGLKVCAIGTSRVTRCPVAYHLHVVEDSGGPRNGAGGAGAGHGRKADPPAGFWYRCEVGGETVEPEEVASAVAAHMKKVKAESATGFSAEHLIVTITTNNPAHTSKCFIDLPGIIENSEKEGEVESVWGVITSALADLRPHDAVIVTAPAETYPASYPLLRKEHPHSLYQVDPDLSHVVLVVTKVDVWSATGNEAPFPPTRRGGTALQERLGQWTVAFGGREPAFVATFRFNDEDAAGMSWDQYRREVLKQCAAKQVKWTEAKRAWVVNRALVDTLEGFEQPILIAMAGAARDARTAAMALLQEDMDGKRAERAKLHRQLKREQPGQLEAELRAVGEAFFAFFSRLYLGRTSELEDRRRAREVLTASATTLAQDLAEIGEDVAFPMVRTAGGALAKPSADEEKAFVALVNGGDTHLARALKPAIDRLLQNYRFRATCIEPGDVGLERLQDAVASSATVNSQNNDTACTAVVVEDTQELLLEHGTRYLLQGIKHKLLRMVDASFQYLWQAELRQSTGHYRGPFMARVQEQVKLAMATILTQLKQQLEDVQTRMLTGACVQFPNMLKSLPDLLVGADGATAVTGMERAKKLATVCNEPLEADQLSAKPIMSWTDGGDEHKKACVTHKRHFAALREWVATGVFTDVSVHLGQRLTVRDARDGLYKSVMDHLITIPSGGRARMRTDGPGADGDWDLVDLTGGDGRKVEEPDREVPVGKPQQQQQQPPRGTSGRDAALRRFYGIADEAASARQRLAELDKEIEVYEAQCTRWM